ncbi:MAG: hypothetical protein JWL88_788 [Parcubacteria group bacterium]|nr:hypothetical protein [Parcubacteria group bacterium]
MLPVTAYVGYESPVIKQALEHLRTSHHVVTEMIEQTASEIEGYAVFVTSPGNFPGQFMKTLFAATPEECACRIEQIRLRGYMIPPMALRSAHIIVLKDPLSRMYAGEELSRFRVAIDNNCGFTPKKPPLPAKAAERRKLEEVAATRARRSEAMRAYLRGDG